MSKPTVSHRTERLLTSTMVATICGRRLEYSRMAEMHHDWFADPPSRCVRCQRNPRNPATGINAIPEAYRIAYEPLAERDHVRPDYFDEPSP